MTINHDIQFFIGTTANNKFAAATKVEPFFCLVRDTQEEAVNAALEAWSLYFKSKGVASNVTIKSRKPFNTNECHITPTEVITAQAC